MITTEEILNSEVRALSWKQPFGTLMLYGKEETRTWHTNYRGLVLICISKNQYSYGQILNISGEYQTLRMMKCLGDNKAIEMGVTLGKAIAIGRLVDCKVMLLEGNEKTRATEDRCFVQYQFGLYRHIYTDVTRIESFAWKGSQGWRILNDEQKKLIKLKPRFKVGDKVIVVHYGSLGWQNKSAGEPRTTFKIINETDAFIRFDWQPELVGKTGVICDVSETQGIITYAIDGIEGKHAWYNQNQLELST